MLSVKHSFLTSYKNNKNRFNVIIGLVLVLSIAGLVYAATSTNNIATSSTNTATTVSTLRRVVRTSDGTLHAFVQLGTETMTCSGTPTNGLLWTYSTDNGTTWTCGGQVSNNTSILFHASAVVDSSDNVYIIYSATNSGANSAYDAYYRKLTKGSGSTWTLENAQTVLDASASTGFNYATIEIEGTDRLWVAARRFDGTNYQISTYYSDGLTTNPTWQTSENVLSVAGNSASYHIPAMFRFGNKIGVVYNSQLPTTVMRWRFREDGESLTRWASETIINNLTATGPTFSVISDSNANAYFALNSTTNVFFNYWNGSVWSQTATVSTTALSNSYVSLTTNGSSVKVIYGESTNLAAGITGLGIYKLSYKNGYLPFSSTEFDVTASPVVSYQTTFDKYWSYNGTTYTNDTTDAASTASADMQMNSVVGSISYFGKLEKFDSIAWDISTNGVGGTIVWEYWNGSAWTALTLRNSSSPNFTADGWINFVDPANWATTQVNAEGTPYYYVRARTSVLFSTQPVGVQALPIAGVYGANFLQNSISGSSYGIWTENIASRFVIKQGSLSYPAVTVNNATNTNAVNNLIGYSTLATATHPSTMKNILQTSDGTFHAFIQAGNNVACDNTTYNGGLVWTYSTDEGVNWNCGAELMSEIVNVSYASAVKDSSDNIYVVYSTVNNGGGVTNDTYFTKLTKGVGSTWSVGTPDLVLDASGTTAYTYSTVEIENNTRLWLATRYFDGVYYQINTYYSSDLSGAPTWNVSKAPLTALTSTNTYLYPAIVRFGSNIGVAYNAPTNNQRWRVRSDSDSLTSWGTENIVSTEAVGSPRFSIISDGSDNVYYGSLVTCSIFATFWNGRTWAPTTTVINNNCTQVASGTYFSLSTDGTNLRLFYGEPLSTSAGIPQHRLVYRTGVPPYSANSFDLTASQVNTMHTTFTKYWSYVSSVYLNDTTDAASVTSADTQMVTNIGDIAFFGSSSKFDTVAWDISTAGTVGSVIWEYWNGTTWVELTDFTSVSNPSFYNDGYINFVTPSNWATTQVNAEVTPYYYVRARVTRSFSVAPVGIQITTMPLISWATALPNTSANKVGAMWAENSISSMPIKFQNITLTSNYANYNATQTDVVPSLGYSANVTSLGPTTMESYIKTSDGTYHAFVQAGNKQFCNDAASTANNVGLMWVYSTNGTNWVCGGQLSGDVTNFMYASATSDSAGNIYVVYSVTANGANIAYSTYYRKLTKGVGSTWTMGNASQVLNASAGGIAYSYSVIKAESDSRLWMATRYFDGTNYQIAVYYSDTLVDSPTWNLSSSSLSTATPSTTDFFPAIVKFGNNMGIVYASQLPASYQMWRYRSNSQDPTVWSSQIVVNTENVSAPSYSVVSDTSGNVYTVTVNGANIVFTYWNGSVWAPSVNLSTTASTSYAGISTDGYNVWVNYLDTTNLISSGLGLRKFVYRKGIPPYTATEWEAATNLVSYHGFFDKYWSYFSSVYLNDTTDVASVATADTQMLRNIGDIAYFGKLEKFDAVSWVLSTAGVGGNVVWEYYNGSVWTPIEDFEHNLNPNFIGATTGIISFSPSSDWQTTTVNSEPTPYYYVRARVTATYSTAPVASQIDTIPNINTSILLPNLDASKVSGLWSENSTAPIRVRKFDVTLSTETPNTASASDLMPTLNSATWYSSTNLTNQSSTQRSIVKTSDGTIHSFVYTANSPACGGNSTSQANSGGLVWMTSSDEGVTWDCKSTLWSDPTMGYYASATVDSNDNIYVVYSQAANGGSVNYDIYYRMITKTGPGTWSMEPQQILLDSITANTGYTYATIEVEGSNRLWVAFRNYTNPNYQVSVYYSSALTSEPVWTLSSLALESAGTSTSYHYPTIVRYGSNIGVIYSNEIGGVSTRWRSRADTDGLTTWGTEATIMASASTGPLFSAVGSDAGEIYLSVGSAATVYFTSWNGSSWSSRATLSSTAITNGFTNVSMVGTTAYVYYTNASGLSAGLPGNRKLVYKRGVAPYLDANFDVSETSIVTYHSLFDKVWSYVSSVYANETTDASNTTSADTQMVSQIGDIIYLGKTSKFDNISWDLSTLGTNGIIRWEYYNGASWKAINKYLGVLTPSFTGDGAISFVPAQDWAQTTVNGEGTSYYYVRGVVTRAFSVVPIGVQFASIPLLSQFTSIAKANNIYYSWTENSTSNYRVRFSAYIFNVAPNTPTSLGASAVVDGSPTKNNQPEFIFTTSDVNLGDTSKYTIQIDNDSDFSSPVVDYTSAFTLNGVRGFAVGQAVGSGIYTTGSQGQTLTDGDYYWRVKASDLAGLESGFAVANSGSVAFKIDTANPATNASSILMLKTAGGPGVNSNGWTNNASPYFSWTPGVDNVGGSGIFGYCVYLGTDSNGNPETSKGLLGTSPATLVDSTCQFITTTTSIDFTNANLKGGTWLTTSSSPYYINIKAIDIVGNIYTTSSAQFQFRFDNVAPTNVAFISTAGGTFNNVADMSFSWPTAGLNTSSDATSGVLGWQYAINITSGSWQGTTDSTELDERYIPTSDSNYSLTNVQDAGSIVTGSNTIYFRTIDQAGNYSSEGTIRTGVLQFGGAAPMFPPLSQVTVTPSVGVSNNYELSWPEAMSGSGGDISNYYYMINITPPTVLSTITTNPATFINNNLSLGVTARSLPNVNRGTNTVYVVAVDEDGHYSPSNYITGTFELNSTEPDNPTQLTASDASIKSENRWMVTLTWIKPAYEGAGNLTYLVHRSLDGVSFSLVGTTTSLSYVDNPDESRLYYYKVYAKDGANQTSSGTNAVSETPTGRWTVPPTLDNEPEVTNITTKKAKISWTTSRKADSKVAYGTESGVYFPVEPSTSDLTPAHEINLNGLQPSTQYYYIARWTDEDGNTGSSTEYSFVTQPAPSVKDVVASNVGLTSAILRYTTLGASKVRIFYGTTTSFGGLKEVSTSTSETVQTTEITGLLDGTKYYYRIDTLDEESAQYEGTILDFTTLPRPKINNVRVQQVRNTAQSTVLISWQTNTEVSSIVTYYPENQPGLSTDEVNVTLTKGDHSMIIRGLLPQTNYNIIVKGRDRMGNEAVSDVQRLTTATDTRPPVLSNIKIEGAISKLSSSSDNTQVAQIVVSWNTDEPATSQVEFGEGTGTTYSQRTQEDTNLTVNHLVVITGLTPSKVYHLRILAKDKAENLGRSVDTVTITPKGTDNALDLVLSSLQQTFGFLNN